MAKDPAFLFYPGDYQGGTTTFSRAQKGAYLDLLIAQFNEGALSITDIKQVLGTDFWMWETKLVSKFQKDANGLYFNQRLRKEMVKRRLFTESRLDNLSSAPHMVDHMENENRNKNITTKTTVVFKPPTLQEVKDYIASRGNKIDPESFHAFYEANGWKQGNKPIKKWQSCVITWERRRAEYVPNQVPVSHGKPQAEVVAIQCVAMGMDDRATKIHMIEKGYSEHRIDEAIMQARGNKH